MVSKILMNAVNAMWSKSLDHVSIIGLVLALGALLWARKKRPGRLPPGPRGVPLLGYLPFLGPDLHREFGDVAERYGPLFKMWLGNKLCVVISSPEMAEEVLREQDTVFANRDSTVAGTIMSYGGNDIALASYGPGWKKLRKIFVREMLNNSILDALYALRREEVRKSVKEIHGRAGEAVDMGHVAFLTAMNAVLRMSCSSSVEDAAAFKKSAEEMVRLLVTPNVSDLFPWLARFDLQGIASDTRKVNRVFEEMFDAAIQERKNNMTSKESDTSSRKDFLQFLVDLNQQEHSSIPISDDELKAMITDTVFGATDTTSTTVEWSMTELLNCPEAMAKVCEELTQVVGLDNIVEESHLSKLTYLNAVIKEILRLHPPLPFLLPRFPGKSTTVAGYDIPQGAKIIVNAWAIHRDPRSWESPCEFRPERFLSGEAEKLRFNSSSNFNYIPFGSGRRICPGLPLAERFTIHVLASFLHMFHWKLPADSTLDLSDKFGSVLKKRHTLIAIPTPRLSNPHLYA